MAKTQIKHTPAPQTAANTLMLKLPAELPAGNIVAHTRHVEINHLTPRERRALARLKIALDGSGNGKPAKLSENDRFVDSNAKAIRWVLNSIADQTEGPINAAS